MVLVAEAIAAAATSKPATVTTNPSTYVGKGREGFGNKKCYAERAINNNSLDLNDAMLFATKLALTHTHTQTHTLYMLKYFARIPLYFT